jgi:hypothetical protein
VTAGCTDVASPDLDLKTYSSRLVSLMTSSLRLSSLFSVGLPTKLFLHSSFVFFSSECYMCNLMEDLYVNLLNENHVIIQSKYQMQK